VFDSVDLSVLSRSMTARLRRRIAYISGSDDALDPRMTIKDTVDEPLQTHLGIAADIIAVYRDAALKRVGLDSYDPGRTVAGLNAFDRRRLQVARATVSAPLLAVIDEPLRGLDAFAQVVMREVLADFRRHQEAAFLVVTSDFTVAQALAEDVFVFKDGKIVERGPVAKLLKSPQEQATRELIDAVVLPNLS
jgi:ABC-type microcin C transport system duplicated ATPase subunit YejF